MWGHLSGRQSLDLKLFAEAKLHICESLKGPWFLCLIEIEEFQAFEDRDEMLGKGLLLAACLHMFQEVLRIVDLQ